MKRRSKVNLDFAGGDFDFCLRIGELIELQEKCDAGPPLILARLQQGAWKVEDVRETIRLGLIGGGMAATEASVKVKAYVDNPDRDPPLAGYALTASAILAAAILSVKEEEAPKSDGSQATTPNPDSLMQNGNSEISTQTAPPPG